MYRKVVVFTLTNYWFLLLHCDTFIYIYSFTRWLLISKHTHHGKVLFGNYYLGEILEIGLVAEESGNIFHSFVKIRYSVPQRVQQLTGVTNITIKSLGVPFRTVMDELFEFLCREQAQSETVSVIIANGGYLHDFPIMLASCMKHNWDRFGILTECMFVDSMQILQNDGYKRPGLDALCEDLNIRRRSPHSALDVCVCVYVCGNSRYRKLVFCFFLINIFPT